MNHNASKQYANSLYTQCFNLFLKHFQWTYLNDIMYLYRIMVVRFFMCMCVAQVISEQMFSGFQDNDKACHWIYLKTLISIQVLLQKYGGSIGIVIRKGYPLGSFMFQNVSKCSCECVMLYVANDVFYGLIIGIPRKLSPWIINRDLNLSLPKW